MPDFIDAKTLALIAHVFGAILGAGGAFASDGIFFSTMKDGRISRDEMRFIRLGGHLVWTGLAVLFISGLFLVAMDPERYFSSTKFLAKLSIVGVIVGNGLAFHLVHIPRMQRNLRRNLASSVEFTKSSAFLVASGAISVVSWTSTVILGMLHSVPYSYWAIMGVYVCLVIAAAAGAVILRKRLFRF